MLGIHEEQVPAVQALLHRFSQAVLLWTEEAGVLVEPRYLSLGFPSFSGHFPSSISRRCLGSEGA